LSTILLLAGTEVVPHVLRVAAVPPLRPNTDIAFSYAVHDARFPLARAMAQDLHPRVDRHFAVRGDVTGFWNQALRPQLHEGRGMMVGVTTPLTLFCLQQMVASLHMHVVTRIDVSEHSSDSVLRTLSDRMQAVLSRSAVPAAGATAWPGPQLTSARMHGESDCLVAWIMAPTTRADVRQA
jgi:hypothetical protein